MALSAYLGQVQRLLQNPGAPSDLYNPADLTLAINEARQQLAAESASIRVLGTLAVTALLTGPYPFSAINLAPAVGVSGAINMQTLWYAVGDGKKWIRPRPWPWFSLFQMNNPVPMGGAPIEWSQLGQGVNGTLYVSPIPDIAYTLTADTVCLPIDLVDDTTPEAIPALWTNAVQYYAAYVALLGAQTGVRMDEAAKYFQLYTEFVNRARAFATPGIVPTIYQGIPNPARAAQLGQQGVGGPGG